MSTVAANPTAAMDTKTEATRVNASPKKGRTIWWALFALSIVAIIISGIQLTKRIGQYYQEVDHPLFAYMQVASTDFTFANRDLTLEEMLDDEGNPIIEVGFGDERLRLDVVYPPKHALPTLFDRQREWFGMFFFADRSGMTLTEFQQRIATDEIRPRLAIVTRTPHGIDPVKEPRFDSIGRDENITTGEMERDRYRFDFYEFKRDGTIEHEIKRFPESAKSFMRRRVNADLKGEPEPQRADDEIHEYTWQYGAALKVTNRPPGITLEKQALLNAGWTLPVAAAGFLLGIVAFFFAIAPARVTEESVS